MGHQTPSPSQEGKATLLDAVTANGAGSSFGPAALNLFFQAVMNGTSGAFSADVDVQVTVDGTNWITAGTISLSGTATTAETDGLETARPYVGVRGNVRNISGTGANVTLYMKG